MQAKPPNAACNPSKKITVATSFDNQNENSIYLRLIRYTQAKGFDKPQDVVRLALSRFLDKEGF